MKGSLLVEWTRRSLQENNHPCHIPNPPQPLNSLPWLSLILQPDSPPPTHTLSLCVFCQSRSFMILLQCTVCAGVVWSGFGDTKAHTVSIHCHFYGYGRCWSGDSQSEIVASIAWFMASPVIPCLVLSVCSDLFFYCSKNMWAYLTVKELVNG